MADAAHTPGPYFSREYAQDAEDLAQMRKLGIKPTRMLTNEGQVALMAGKGDDVKRIALIDCQTRYKRGEGYKTECAERDANTALFAAVPGLLDLAKNVGGFDDSLLLSADLNVLRGALREYRDQARASLPPADRRSV